MPFICGLHVMKSIVRRRRRRCRSHPRHFPPAHELEALILLYNTALHDKKTYRGTLLSTLSVNDWSTLIPHVERHGVQGKRKKLPKVGAYAERKSKYASNSPMSAKASQHHESHDVCSVCQEYCCYYYRRENGI